jgi:hypothetical protein
LHIVAAIVVVAVFWLRVRNRPLIPRSWFASARGA